MTILNETTELIQEGYTWGISYRSIFPFILGGALIIFGIKIICNTEWKVPNQLEILILVICIFIVGLAGCVAGFHTKPVYKEVKQYEVTINPFTPFRMIYDNYDIIEQHGDIFVLRDKGWNDNTE